VYSIHRLRNGIAKVLAGLTPFGESVWPGVRNDLFVAHESIYRFFAQHATGKRVLDAGCGTGYGASILAHAGAPSVSAVDLDARSIAYARRHFAHPAISFEVSDLERLLLSERSLDLVVSSNALEHLSNPAAFLALAAAALVPGGHALIAVPPITFPGAMSQHERIHYHRSNLTVDQWLELFTRERWARTELLAHRYTADHSLPDLASHRRSGLSPEGFSFAPVTRDIAYSDPPITVVFSLLRGAA
jgi:SAM-dependent methyltransferase